MKLTEPRNPNEDNTQVHNSSLMNFNVVDMDQEKKYEHRRSDKHGIIIASDKRAQSVKF